MKEEKVYPKPKHDWIHYPIHGFFDESIVLDVEIEFLGEKKIVKRRFCKTCYEEDHHLIQGDGMDVCDCKCEFHDRPEPGSQYRYGKSRGQCSCYSYEHGVRDRKYW